MRQIGYLPSEEGAKVFGDYLYAQGIENQIDNDDKLGWVIWVAEEDQLPAAQAALAEFKANPADARYTATAAKAPVLRAQKQKQEAAWVKKQLDRRQLFRPLTAYGPGRLTIVLVGISIIVFFASSMGDSPQKVSKLYISWFLESGLSEVRHGQIWRLLTPIFVHMDFMHIFFNMWWLWDLGSMIEGRQGTRQLLFLVLIIGVASNLAQYVLYGPAFGGMSGVVYGLLGYIWMRGKFEPASGLFLPPGTVMIMLVWFFLCLFGVIRNVANAAHAAGLVLGMAWGWLSSLKRK